MKLNTLLSTHQVTVYGFGAFKALEAKSQGSAPAILATDSPAVMYERGISQYYAPMLPRGARYSTADEILAADLAVNEITVLAAPPIEACDNVIIVSGHQGTRDHLLSLYPSAHVIPGNVAPEMIKGKNVVGTLPPHLIGCCHRYRAATIKDFDYAKDGDLSGQELMDRLILTDTISVTVKS